MANQLKINIPSRAGEAPKTRPENVKINPAPKSSKEVEPLRIEGQYPFDYPSRHQPIEDQSPAALKALVAETNDVFPPDDYPINMWPKLFRYLKSRTNTNIANLQTRVTNLELIGGGGDGESIDLSEVFSRIEEAKSAAEAANSLATEAKGLATSAGTAASAAQSAADAADEKAQAAQTSANAAANSAMSAGNAANEALELIEDIQELPDNALLKLAKYYPWNSSETADDVLDGVFLMTLAHAGIGGQNYVFIIQTFYGEISTEANRSQLAFAYNGEGVWQRAFFEGSWTNWISLATDALATQTVKGLLSPADKKKLDNLQVDTSVSSSLAIPGMLRVGTSNPYTQLLSDSLRLFNDTGIQVGGLYISGGDDWTSVYIRALCPKASSGSAVGLFSIVINNQGQGYPQFTGVATPANQPNSAVALVGYVKSAVLRSLGLPEELAEEARATTKEVVDEALGKIHSGFTFYFGGKSYTLATDLYSQLHLTDLALLASLYPQSDVSVCCGDPDGDWHKLHIPSDYFLKVFKDFVDWRASELTTMQYTYDKARKADKAFPIKIAK